MASPVSVWFLRRYWLSATASNTPADRLYDAREREARAALLQLEIVVAVALHEKLHGLAGQELFDALAFAQRVLEAREDAAILESVFA